VLNGPAMLTAADILKPTELIQAILAAQKPLESAIKERLSADLLKAFKKVDAAHPVPERLVEQLTDELNSLIAAPDVLSRDVENGIQLSAATRKVNELLDQGAFDENRRRIEMLRRNRLLLEDAFSDAIQRCNRNDILEIVRYLIDLKNGRGVIDDIDHLGNRRVRAVGELLENQYRIGLVRMERAIKERMSLQEVETSCPTT